MNVQMLLSKIAFYLTAPRCVACGKNLEKEDKAICKDCLVRYQNHKERSCATCLKPLPNCTCSPVFLDTHFVHKLYKTVRYNDREDSRVSNALIFAVKEKHRKDCISFVAEEMAAHIFAAKNKENAVIVSVPRRKASIKKYGYDHTKEIGKEMSKLTDIPYVSLLSSKAKKAQKSLRGKERLANAKYKVKFNVSIEGKDVILVDDIVTTGASMASSATLLKGEGAKNIYGLCFAIAYKDNKNI